MLLWSAIRSLRAEAPMFRDRDVIWLWPMPSVRRLGKVNRMSGMDVRLL